jgi:hypothetical protein
VHDSLKPLLRAGATGVQKSGKGREEQLLEYVLPFLDPSRKQALE